MSHNKLSTANDIAELAHCEQLAIVDLSYNYLDDPKIVEVSRNKIKALTLKLYIDNITKRKQYKITINCT